MKKILFVLILFTFAYVGVINAQSDIRRVDFNNFTYHPLCNGDKSEAMTVTVKNGKYVEKEEDSSSEFSFEIDNILFADLNGDGREEAAITAECRTGGTSRPTEGFIYGIVGRKPKMLTRIAGGDRGQYGLVDAKIADKLLVIEQNDPGEVSADCCPEFITTTKYKLENNKLVAVGKPSSVEFNPSIRVEFAKGASSRTITVNLKSHGNERYKVAAREGQTLIVTADSPDVSVFVLNSSAESIDIPHGVSAKLNSTRDAVFEISNKKAVPQIIKITISIN